MLVPLYEAVYERLEVGPGTRLLFEQDVVVRKPLMRLLALPGRPFFTANHALMMRSGRTGLLARLAAAGRGDVV